MSGKVPEVPADPHPDRFCSQFFQYTLFSLLIFVTPAATTAPGVAVPFESSPGIQHSLQLSLLYTRARSSLQLFPRNTKRVSYPSWQGLLPSPLQAVPNISSALLLFYSKCKPSSHFAVLKHISCAKLWLR